jgi:putative membrane protein
VTRVRNPLSRPEWMNEGEDPDYRFSLANERTFLAWVRTTLAFVAAAVAVVQLVPPFRIGGSRTVLGIVLAATALFTSVFAYLRWRDSERAMRNGMSLPHPLGLPLVAASLFLVSAIVLILVLVGHR